MPDSHLNAVKHGCTARSPILPGEDETLWREVEADWFIDYEPQTNTSRTLVAEAALAFWFMVRTRRTFQKVDLHLAEKDPLAWTGDDHNLFTRFNRYKTAAERAFSNAFKNLEYLRKARYTEAEAQRRLEQRIDTLHFQMQRDGAKQNLAEARFVFEQQKHADAQANKETTRGVASTTAKKNKKDTFEVAEQWMEITVTDGVTKTEYIPTNEEFLAEFRKTQLVPKLVYRRMNFPDGVPPEYAWTNLHDIQTCQLNQAGQWCEGCARYLYGGHGMQRMTFDTWKEVIVREAFTPGQHAGPVGNLPRPKERGGDHDYAELLALEARQKQLNRERDLLFDDQPPEDPFDVDDEEAGSDQRNGVRKPGV